MDARDRVVRYTYGVVYDHGKYYKQNKRLVCDI